MVSGKEYFVLKNLILIALWVPDLVWKTKELFAKCRPNKKRIGIIAHNRDKPGRG